MAKKRKIKRSGMADSSPSRKLPSESKYITDEMEDIESDESPSKKGMNSFLSVSINSNAQITHMGRLHAKGVHCIARLNETNQIQRIKKVKKAKTVSFHLIDQISSSSTEERTEKLSSETGDTLSQRNLFETFDTAAYNDTGSILLKQAKDITQDGNSKDNERGERENITHSDCLNINFGKKSPQKGSLNSDNTDSIKGLSDMTVLRDNLSSEEVIGSISEESDTKEDSKHDKKNHQKHYGTQKHILNDAQYKTSRKENICNVDLPHSNVIVSKVISDTDVRKPSYFGVLGKPSLNEKENSFLELDQSTTNLKLEIVPYKKGCASVIDLYSYGNGLFQVPSKQELTGSPIKYKKKRKNKIKNLLNFKEEVTDKNKDAHCFPTPRSSPDKTNDDEPTWDFDEYEFDSPQKGSYGSSVITEPIEGGDLIGAINLEDDTYKVIQINDQGDLESSTNTDKSTEVAEEYSNKPQSETNFVVDHSVESSKMPVGNTENIQNQPVLNQDYHSSKSVVDNFENHSKNVSNEIETNIPNDQKVSFGSDINKLPYSEKIDKNKITVHSNNHSHDLESKTEEIRKIVKTSNIHSIITSHQKLLNTPLSSTLVGSSVYNVAEVSSRKSINRKTVASKIKKGSVLSKVKDKKSIASRPRKKRRGRPKKKSKTVAKCANLRRSSRNTKKENNKFTTVKEDVSITKTGDSINPAKLSDSPVSLLALAQVASDELSLLTDENEVANNCYGTDAGLSISSDSKINETCNDLHQIAIEKVLPSPIVSSISQPKTEKDCTAPRIGFVLDEDGTIKNQTNTEKDNKVTVISTSMAGLPSGLHAHHVPKEKFNKEMKMDLAAKVGEALHSYNSSANHAPSVRQLLSEKRIVKKSSNDDTNILYQNFNLNKKLTKIQKPRRKRKTTSKSDVGSIPYTTNTNFPHTTTRPNLFVYPPLSLTPENQQLLQTIENNRRQLQLGVSSPHPPISHLNLPPIPCPATQTSSHMSNIIGVQAAHQSFARMPALGPFPQTGVQVFRYPAHAVQPPPFQTSVQILPNLTLPATTHSTPMVFPPWPRPPVMQQGGFNLRKHVDQMVEESIRIDGTNKQNNCVESTLSTTKNIIDDDNNKEYYQAKIHSDIDDMTKINHIDSAKNTNNENNDQQDQSVAVDMSINQSNSEYVEDKETIVQENRMPHSDVNDYIAKENNDNIIINGINSNENRDNSEDVLEQNNTNDIEFNIVNNTNSDNSNIEVAIGDKDIKPCNGDVSSKEEANEEPNLTHEKDFKNLENDNNEIPLIISKVVGGVQFDHKSDFEQEVPPKGKKSKRKMQDIRDIHRNTNTPPKKPKIESTIKSDLTFQTDKSGLELLSDAAELPRLRDSTSPDTTTNCPQDNTTKDISSENIDNQVSSNMASQNMKKSTEHIGDAFSQVTSSVLHQEKNKKISEFSTGKPSASKSSDITKVDSTYRSFIKRSEFERMNIRNLKSFSKEELYKELVRRNSVTPCICGTGFTDSAMYMLHRASHNTDEPHMCGLCGKTGHSWMDFFVHLYDHNK